MKNKVVWITGATSGIGEALAYQFAVLGANLVLSARRIDELERVKKACTETSILCLPLDLEQSENFPQLAQKVQETYGKIDILINNGGISQRSETHETPLEIDRKIMEINYFGNIALTKAVLPFMIVQKSGHIVPISSLAGKFGFFMRSAYAASKHALHGFYEALRLEQEKNNIQVTIICPALIKTAISLHSLDENGKERNIMDEKQAKGMPADVCAKKIIEAIQKNKKEVLIGNGEQFIVVIKRFFPALFYRIIRKQKAT
jgi:dehydrogenase/reductase SDR family member 7B